MDGDDIVGYSNMIQLEWKERTLQEACCAVYNNRRGAARETNVAEGVGCKKDVYFYTYI